MSTLAVVNRVALLYDVKDIIEEIGEFYIEGASVYIDEKNKDYINEIIESNPRKCERALGLALQDEYLDDVYGREKINGKASHVTAIKYKGKHNYRIYCQEIIINKKKVIIMCKGYHKKTQKAKDTKTAAVIDSVARYSFLLK